MTFVDEDFPSCLICAKPVLSGTRRRKYCSKDCYLEANKRLGRQKYWDSVKDKPATKTVICGWCNKQLELPHSANAPRKYHDDCKIQARRARDRIKTVKRQGYRSNYLVTHEEIAKRDNYTCQICNEPVDMSLPRTSRFGATLDHIMPISKGGTDTLENLQLSHWVCNNRKSDKVNYAESR